MKDRASCVARCVSRQVVCAVFAAAVIAGCGSAWADIPASAYVQTGLIGLWDGMENALDANGMPCHDAQATTWVNLATGEAMALETVASDSWTADAYCLGTTSSRFKFAPNGLGGEWTLQMRVTDNANTMLDSQDDNIWWKWGAGIKFAWRNSTRYNLSKWTAGETLTLVSAADWFGVHQQTAGWTKANDELGDKSYGKWVAIGKGADGDAPSAGAKYHSIRVYDHALTDEEMEWNALVDGIRFGTSSDSYRWNAAKRIIETRLEVTGADGALVSLDNETFAASASAWYARGERVTLFAKPATEALIGFWQGLPAGAQVSVDGKSATFTILAPVSAAVSSHTAVALYWRGSGSDVASDSSKWAASAEGMAAVTTPQNGDRIVLDADSGNLTWDIPNVRPGSWTQTEDYVGTVTLKVGTSRAEAGSVAPDGVNRELHVTGNIDLQGGLLTCGGNSGLTAKANPEAINSSEGNYRLWLRADGNVTVGTGATVDVSRCGFNYGVGKGSIGLGGCHGGTDYQAHPGSCFGNVYEPAEVGPGGNSSFSTYGAGAVKIVAGGQLRVDGLIDARPSDKRPTGYTGAATHYTAAGGSIWLTANSLAGAGMIRADGGPATTAPTAGGGRIAIYLKGVGETLDGFTGTMTCYGSGNNMAMPGTIYCELASDVPHRGELIVRNRNAAAPSRYQDDNTNNTVCTPLIPLDDAATTYNFRKISLYGGAILAVAANATLDLTDTEIVASEGTYADALTLLGGTLRLPDDSYTFSNLQLWVSATGSTIEFADGTGTLTLGKGGRFDSPIRIPGSLVLAGGSLTHTAQGKGYKRYWIDLDIPGDLTIAADASINVTGCGYAGGPGAPVTSGAGYSYGGFGGDAVAEERCYGDPRNPDECGSAGTSAGGLVKLKVGGQFNLNGSVLARGSIGSSAGGTGGGVNITAGRLVGAGPINASSMLGEYNWTQYHSRWDAAGAGGGRVAISITAQDATFDDYTGVIEVVGSANNGKKRKGGNGTIYLRRPGEGLEDGTLIIDVKNDDPSAGAGICAKTGNITVGNVILRNKGKLNVRKGLTVSVKGDVTNDGTGQILGELGDADNEPGGIALVDEERVSHLTGPLDFVKLSCTLPGKTVAVASDETTCVGVVAGGLLDLHGDEDTPVRLRSATEGSQWKMAIADGARVNLQYLDVKDSNASESELKPSANDSTDSGNNDGWTFVNIKKGEIVTWTGEAGTTGWGNPQNWISESAEVRAPTDTDKIVIPSGCSVYPEFSAGVTVGGLEIASGASLNLNGFALTVTEGVRMAGSLVCTAKEQIMFCGDVDFTGGAFTAANSTVTIGGTGDRTVNFANLAFDSVAFANVGGTATVTGGLSARRLFASAAQGPVVCRFAADVELRAQQLYLDGVGEVPGITLTDVGGETWKLSVSRYQQVRGVAVSHCNASGGIAIWDEAPYSDLGGNANWNFTAGACRWTGAGANADFTNELNWADGRVPAATDRVKLVGGETINFPADAAIGSLELMGGVTHLTAANGAKLAVGGVLYAEDGTKCYLDVPTTADSALIRSGAHIVCTPSTTTTATYRKIDLAVTGDMEIEEDGWIDAVGRGFSPPNGWGQTGTGTSCWGHGGTLDPVGLGRTYGSVFEPTLPGTGGSTSHRAEGCDPELDAHGGGVIRLQVGGTLLLNGTVSADGWTKQNYYSATGGSVWLTVGRLAGAGLVTAKGGLVLTSTPGCGGRVAVYRTAETKEESTFSGVIRANGGSLTSAGSASTSAPGTVYLSYADTAEKAGEIIIDNLGGSVEYARNTKAGAVLTSQFGDQPEDFKEATIRIGPGAGLTISADMRVKDVSLESASSYLVIPTPATEEDPTPVLTIESLEHKHGIGWLGKTLPAGTGTGRRKKYDYIKWMLPGFMLIVK